MTDIAAIEARHRDSHWCMWSSEAENGGLYEDYSPDERGRFCDAAAAATEAAQLRAERDAERELADRLAEALRRALGQLGGKHSAHWDSTMQHGRGCPVCIAEGETKDELRLALEAHRKAREP